jgi:hypothetical protein
MTLEIHRPELAALIRERIDSGVDVEDVIMQALQSSSAPKAAIRPSKVSISILKETPTSAVTLLYERFPSGYQHPFGAHPPGIRAAGGALAG